MSCLEHTKLGVTDKTFQTSSADFDHQGGRGTEKSIKKRLLFFWLI